MKARIKILNETKTGSRVLFKYSRGDLIMKNIILLLILGLIVLAGSASAQGYIPEENYSLNIGDWRVSREPVSFNMSASMTHMIGSAYLANSFEKTMPWWQADLTALSLGLIWEIKDGYVPWEKGGVLGGEGFSYNDLKMDFLGVVLNRVLPVVLEKSVSTIRNFDTSKYSFGISGKDYPKVLFSIGM